MGKTKRVLIFGGTFDPPHMAHVTLPAMAAQILECQQILYIPAAISPLKSDQSTTGQDHRLAMLSLAISDIPDSQLCTCELDRNGPSYTIDTLESLRERFGEETELRLLIGADQAIDFHRWKDWQRILTLATPAVMLRSPWDLQSFRKKLHEIYSDIEAEQWLNWTLRLPVMDVCASEIRKRIQSGESLNGLLDPAVAEYIRSNGLYSCSSARSAS